MALLRYFDKSWEDVQNKLPIAGFTTLKAPRLGNMNLWSHISHIMKFHAATQQQIYPY